MNEDCIKEVVRSDELELKFSQAETSQAGHFNFQAETELDFFDF